MRIKGWEKVFKFTYLQMVKSKSFIVSGVIMFVLIALMLAAGNYLPALLADDKDSEIIQVTDENGNVIGEIEKSKIEKVYILNNSGLNIDFSFLKTIQVSYETIDQSKTAEVMETVTNSLGAEVLAIVEPSEGGFTVKMSRPESTEIIKNSDCYSLLNSFNAAINDANLMSLGVAEENVGKAVPLITTSVNVNGEEPQSEIMEVITMVLTLGTSIIMFVLIIAYGQLTAQAIATEKASRVMELLLTSVKPLAVIVGKVLGTLFVALTSIVAIGGGSAILFFIFAPMGTLGEIVGMVDTTDPALAAVSAELGSAFGGFTAGNIIWIIVIFVMGFLFFSLIAGLIGASVSKIEDLQTALQPLMIISVLGFYLTYFSSFTGLDPDGKGNALVTLSRYLPISSPFALPSAIIAGEMTTGQVAVAVGVLALCLVVFALFVAKVYEHIILHNGDRLKIKDMLKLAKS